jgi:hypothetical protein
MTDDTPEKIRAYTAKILHKLPFFCRIKAKVMVEKGYIKDMKIETFNERDVLLMPDDDSVYVVINGKVIMREHSTDDPIDTTMKQIAKSGSILGVDQLDTGVSNLPYIWGIVASTKCELVRIKRSVFEKIWFDTVKNSKEVGLKMMQQHVFFKVLSA